MYQRSVGIEGGDRYAGIGFSIEIKNEKGVKRLA